MRVTNSMMMNSFLTNLNSHLAKVSKYNEQVSSGRKMTRLSDNPVGVLDSMNARQKLLRLSQYSDNLTNARAWVEQSESAMSEMSNTLTEIYGKLVEGASDTKVGEDKKYLAREIRSLTDHIMQTANTSIGSQYIFGGFNTGNPPFTRDASGKALYNGLDLSDASPANSTDVAAEATQTIQFEIGFSTKLQVSPNGVELMGTGAGSILNMLDSMATDLENGADADTLTNWISSVKNAQTTMRQNVVGVGARAAKIETLENRYSQSIIELTEVKSQIEDVDITEAILNLKQSEAIYSYALQAGAQVIQPSLLDFLR